MSTETAEQQSGAALAARYALATAGPVVIDDPTKPHAFVVPENATLQTPDFARWLEHAPAPPRASWRYVVHNVDSFVEFVTRHGGGEGATVWIDPDQHTLIAVLNDHADDDETGPAWGDHRVKLQLRKSPEWIAWTRFDGELLEQKDFAAFCEENQLDFISPDAATMLEVAQTIHSATNVEYKSGYDLQDGRVQFRFEEVSDTRAGENGQIAPPREFVIGIPPFFGEAAFRVRALLKWRVIERRLHLGYKLERPHLVLQAAIDRIENRLRNDKFKQNTDEQGTVTEERVEPGFPRVYVGAPAEPRNR